ncbi:hypothetical protein K402DRAFT_413725 [Aulographum hederae CBS 113979]|uniref:UBL3-like ubiquitin domain-containing protein n=1 Tax=Aulographum hederae CBS 113979 TaxID=1176131 RepID=A0A6G1GVK2_9PEZI|nr:hypothetical protein K402DRAFT_413725 [Aulographum hederae CBS 113979]
MASSASNTNQTSAETSQSSAQAASSPVEMTNLSENTRLPTSDHLAQPEPVHLASSASASNKPQSSDPNNTKPQIAAADPMAQSPEQTRETTRETTVVGIGPSSELPSPRHDLSDGPILTITLLLPNGARHPYILDANYLKKRNVQVENNDPFKIGVYTLKELIWRDWRPEWEPRPTAPNSIRLISFGRLLDDKLLLTEYRFNTTAANVLHMTVKPQEVVDEEEQNAKASRNGRHDGDDEDRTAGCRCTIL